MASIHKVKILQPNVVRIGGPGCYQVINPDDGMIVTIIRNNELRGPDKWIAAAQWDRNLLTDPLPTKRDAVIEAKRMIANKKPL